MEKYIVTIKGMTAKDEPEFINVSGMEAKEILKRWDEHRNITINGKTIPWSRIQEVTTPPNYKQIDRPKCAKCEDGWIRVSTGDPKYPYANRSCECNPRGKEIVREYRQYLEEQNWYKNQMRDNT